MAKKKERWKKRKVKRKRERKKIYVLRWNRCGREERERGRIWLLGWNEINVEGLGKVGGSEQDEGGDIKFANIGSCFKVFLSTVKWLIHFHSLLNIRRRVSHLIYAKVLIIIIQSILYILPYYSLLLLSVSYLSCWYIILHSHIFLVFFRTYFCKLYRLIMYIIVLYWLIHPSVNQCIYLSIYLSIYLTVCSSLPIYLPVSLPFRPSLHLFAGPRYKLAR